MKLRTTDPHVEHATQKFFENLSLEQPALEYFCSASVKEKISEGYNKYKELLKKCVEIAPEGAEESGTVAAEKLTITENAYEEYILEVFKEKIEDIFHSASLYIDIKAQLVELFKKQDAKDLEVLVLNSIDEFLEGIVQRFKNFIVLLIKGIPMEDAEEIVEHAGDDEIVLFDMNIVDQDDDSDDDKSEGEESQCCCGGECNGNCKCGEVNHEGHCQCEGGCKCGNHADE